MKIYFNTCKRATVIFHLIGLLFILSFPSVIPVERSYTCNNTSTYANGSIFSSNLNRVMGDLVKKAPQTGFNTSFYGKSPNRIYGLLQCQGNISKQDCSICSQQANDSVIQLCGNEAGGRVWMDNCFLRYEKFDFISKLDTNGSYLENVNNISSNVNSFRSTTSDLLSNLSDQAYAPANKGFAEGTAEDSSFGTIYGLVQCWRDISIKDCKSCLQLARSNLYQCCSIKQGAQAMLGSCTARYEIFPFFDTPSGGNSPPPPPPSAANPPTVAAHAPSAKGTSRTTSSNLFLLLLLLSFAALQSYTN